MADVRAVLAQLEDDLVEVAAGTTVIGSTRQALAAELAAPDMQGVEPGWLLKEVPRHSARLATFRISCVPLTVHQLTVLAAETGIPPVLAAGPDHPGTVDPARTFALYEALSGLLGRTVTPPSEQQWVRAARGDDERVYPWGDAWADEMANLRPTSLGRTCPVGSYPRGRSAYGLLDMAGNADELTRTLYAPFPGAPAEVPAVEHWAHSPYVTKGGGFLDGRDLARCDRRHGVYVQGAPLALRLVVE